MPFWIVMPFVNRWDWTEQALKDCLAQSGLPEPPQVLAIAQGVDRDTRDALERWTEKEPRLHAWFHHPALPSLSATWNLALRFVWDQGGSYALVTNNDVRLHPQTYARLVDAGSLPVGEHDDPPLFVSAIGRREADVAWEEYFACGLPTGAELAQTKGGPDFSCFCVTKSGHWKYPFDEGFIPAYCEDNDCHRRYMLGGDGHRIFSVNLPYLHYGSGTVNADPQRRAAWAQKIAGSRAHYVKKWGGDVNAERFTLPFDAATDQAGVTNPELQRRYLEASDAAATSTV